jgi:tetratricopeptide (TPR) repeat protein
VFALDPASASGLQLRGWIHYSRARIQDAVHDLKAALEIDANNPDTLGLLSNCYLISGKVAEGRLIIERLIAVDPLTPLNRCMPGFADIMEGNFAAAVAPYRQMFEMDPGNPMARLFYVWVLILNRRTEAVGALLEAFPGEVRETVPARLAFFLAHALGECRRRDRDADAGHRPVATANDMCPRMLAQGYAGRCRSARCTGSTSRSPRFINYRFTRYDPFLENLGRIREPRNSW